jgi:GNAT superfamily N-acetyltransferase
MVSPKEKLLGDDIVIRAIQRDDFQQWAPLWEGYNAFYGRKGETALPEAVSNMTWSRFFDAYEPMHALVAEQSDQLIGIVHYLFHRSTISIEPSCYLQDLFTAEDLRGTGVGRALIEEVYRRAAVAGCNRVYWHTHETNATAMALYNKVAEQTDFVVYRKLL